MTERRLNSGRFEYSCEVEYGPVFGANESDFKRALSRKANGPVEVFGFSRRELTAKDIEEMEAKLSEIESLAERKQLEQALTKMRQGSGR